MDQIKTMTLPQLRLMAKQFALPIKDINGDNLSKSDLLRNIMMKSIAQIIKKFPAYKSIKKMGYDVEYTLDPEEMEQLCCICNPDFLDRSYEELVYGSVDAEEGIIGLYIKDSNNNVILTTVIDFGCSIVCRKVPVSEDLINDYMEITILCSNLIHRIPGLASLLIDLTKQIAGVVNKKHLLLIVSKWEKNKGAVSFYKKNGFVPTKIKEIMVYDVV